MVFLSRGSARRAPHFLDLPLAQLLRAFRPKVLFGLAAASLILCSCQGDFEQHSAIGQTPVRSLLEMRREHVVVQDFDLSCGAAALATVLNFQHGESLTEREVARGLMQRKEYLEKPEVVRFRQGFSLLDLKRFAERQGYKGVGYGKLELADLIELAPIIVPVNIIGYNHFVVIRGFVGDRVMLADPAFGNRSMHVGRFEDVWLIDGSGMGRVGFVVERSDGQRALGDLYVTTSTTLQPDASVIRQFTMPTTSY